jgi:hypothetical protein
MRVTLDSDSLNFPAGGRVPPGRQDVGATREPFAIAGWRFAGHEDFKAFSHFA